MALARQSVLGPLAEPWIHGGRDGSFDISPAGKTVASRGGDRGRPHEPVDGHALAARVERCLATASDLEILARREVERLGARGLERGVDRISRVAAPAFAQIAKFDLQYLSVPPNAPVSTTHP